MSDEREKLEIEAAELVTALENEDLDGFRSHVFGAASV
jgi:hypothetical protein